MGGDTEVIILTMLQGLQKEFGDYREDMGILKESVKVLDGKIDQTLAQALRTNGRVNELEKLNAERKGANATRKSVWDHIWDVGKLLIAASVGFLFSWFKR